MSAIKRLKKYENQHYKTLLKRLHGNQVNLEFLGVKEVFAKRVARELIEDNDYLSFLNDLPHAYYDEYVLHAMLISFIDDYDLVLKEIYRLAEYIEYWGIFSLIEPVTFKTNRQRSIDDLTEMLKSDKTSIQYFAIGYLSDYYFKRSFRKEHIELIAKIKSDSYDIKEMQKRYMLKAIIIRRNEAINYLFGDFFDKELKLDIINEAIEDKHVSEYDKFKLKQIKKDISI